MRSAKGVPGGATNGGTRNASGSYFAINRYTMIFPSSSRSVGV
jgi:hypothetical protein